MNLFNAIQVRKPKNNVFDLSHEVKLSMNMGDLVPILCQEVVPGDRFRVNTEIMMRLAPLVAPVMHRVNVYTHFFFVPNRLVWTSWEDFITGGEDGTAAPTFPCIPFDNNNKADYAPGTLADYLGIPKPPADVTHSIDISALPFRAYQLIYNEYYRDQNFTGTEVAFNKTGTLDAGDAGRLMTLRKRAWEKDYFTSALPWTQRGSSVQVAADPVYNDISSYVKHNTGLPPADGTTNIQSGEMNMTSGADTNEELRVENIDHVDVDINDLRLAARLQEWLERNARAGSRYVEQIFAHFGIKSSDARLQRPEYLGGGRAPVVISEVLSTAETAENPQGTMSGHGMSVGKSNSFKKFFEEHGYIIGIMSVLPRTAYQQGIERHFQKFDKFEYYFPEFANLGEQAVWKSEIYHDWADVNWTEKGTWGYQSRFAEYKFKQSSVHGDFVDDLYFWHMGRIFSSQPSLNAAFNESNPTHRVFAVTTETVHKLYVQLYNNIQAVRPMPVFGIPNL